MKNLPLGLVALSLAQGLTWDSSLQNKSLVETDVERHHHKKHHHKAIEIEKADAPEEKAAAE